MKRFALIMVVVLLALSLSMPVMAKAQVESGTLHGDITSVQAKPGRTVDHITVNVRITIDGSSHGVDLLRCQLKMYKWDDINWWNYSFTDIYLPQNGRKAIGFTQRGDGLYKVELINVYRGNLGETPDPNFPWDGQVDIVEFEIVGGRLA